MPGSHQDAVARSLRVKNLPKDTQEPLLQQIFERLVLVQRVEVFVDSGEPAHQQVSKRNGEVQADRGKRDNWMISNTVRTIYGQILSSEAALNSASYPLFY